MNIVSKVTLAYMKKNMKRTVVTIMGAIISVAMITAVLTSIDSFMGMFQRQIIAEEGDWMVQFKGLTTEQLARLPENKAVDKISISQTLGFSLLESENDLKRPYVYVQSVGSMDEYQPEVLEGRLPENDSEIVLQSHMLESAGLSVSCGDTFDVSLGHREISMENGEAAMLDNDVAYQNDPEYEQERFIEDGTKKTYTVVGIIAPLKSEYGWEAGYTALTKLDTDTIADGIYNVKLTFQRPGMNFYSEMITWGQELGLDVDQLRFHDSLMTFYGVTVDSGMNGFLVMMGTMLIVIIMIGSVLMIYNAFAISLSERSLQLGMLSSVGATKNQKRRSVFFEGAVIGCISIPLGILAGIGGMAVTFALLNPVIQNMLDTPLDMVCVVNIKNILLAALLAMLTIFISAWIPAARASKITPIDAIRRSKDIVLSRRQVRTLGLTKKIFGFSGELAIKNMKRNKKSYRTTIISLVVSVALFLSIAGYVTALQAAYAISDRTSSWDVYADCSSTKGMELCTELPSAEKYNAVTRYYDGFYFQEKDYEQLGNQQYLDFCEEQGTSMEYWSNFYGMSREALETYVSEAGLGNEVMEAFDDTSEGIPVIIVKQYDIVTDNYQWAQMDVLNVNAGEIYALDTDAGTGERTKNAVNVKIAAAADKAPMGLSNEGYANVALQLITLDTYVEELGAYIGEKTGSSMSMRRTVYMSSSDPEQLSADVEKLVASFPDTVTNYYSAWESEQSDRALLLMIQVFCYGFITLMTLICTANILNTISTGIELRRREFAMLKSVGMDPKAFRRMLVFESLFYGLKALLYGLPIGIAVMFLEYRMVSSRFAMNFLLPLPYILTAIVVVFIIVGISTAYSFGKIKKENILDGLRTE